MKIKHPARFRPLIDWIRFYDQWLTDNVVSAKEAADMARADGVRGASRGRVVDCAQFAGAKWYADPFRRMTARQRETNLTGRQWFKLDAAIICYQRAIRERCQSVAHACRFLPELARVPRRPIPVMRAALAARGIQLPDRADRPAYEPKGSDHV